MSRANTSPEQMETQCLASSPGGYLHAAGSWEIGDRRGNRGQTERFPNLGTIFRERSVCPRFVETLKGRPVSLMYNPVNVDTSCLLGQ
jgi:hypothetical protein